MYPIHDMTAYPDLPIVADVDHAVQIAQTIEALFPCVECMVRDEVASIARTGDYGPVYDPRSLARRAMRKVLSLFSVGDERAFVARSFRIALGGGE